MSERRLNNWIDTYLAYNKETEPPTIFHKWCAISLIAASLQRKCKVRWGSLIFYPNMYIVLVAPSGVRKGTAMGPALRILKKVGIRVSAESTTREALIRRLGETTEMIQGKDSFSMENHSSLTVFSPELTCFLGYNNLVLMSDLCDWYDCRDSWTYDTKHEGTDEILGVFVNIIGGTTPDLIQSTMPLEAIGGGLTSRMIFIFEERKQKRVAFPFPPDNAKRIEDDLVHDLAEINMMQGKFKFNQQFLSDWYDWYQSMPETCPFDPQRFSGYWERRANHVMKLCMILNVARSDSMLITEEDLAHAIATIVEAEQKMPRTFGGVGRLHQADVINKILADIAYQKEVKRSELLRRYIRDITSFDMDKVLSTLEGSGFIETVTKAGDTIIRYREQNENKDQE
jgi:hypothetical protein